MKKAEQNIIQNASSDYHPNHHMCHRSPSAEKKETTLTKIDFVNGLIEKITDGGFSQTNKIRIQKINT